MLEELLVTRVPDAFIKQLSVGEAKFAILAAKATFGSGGYFQKFRPQSVS